MGLCRYIRLLSVVYNWIRRQSRIGTMVFSSHCDTNIISSSVWLSYQSSR
jgi:hypothetical protein